MLPESVYLVWIHLWTQFFITMVDRSSGGTRGKVRNGIFFSLINRTEDCDIVNKNEQKFNIVYEWHPRNKKNPWIWFYRNYLQESWFPDPVLHDGNPVFTRLCTYDRTPLPDPSDTGKPKKVDIGTPGHTGPRYIYYRERDKRPYTYSNLSSQKSPEHFN